MATYVEPGKALSAGTHIHHTGTYYALVYVLKAEYGQTGAQHQEFMEFYENSVIPWFKHNKVGHAYAWLSGNYLFCVGSREMVILPWVTGIEGLTRYMALEKPLPVANLPSYEG